jgi:hypothetical protein
MQCDSSGGNPIITAVPENKRWVTAVITGIATKYDIYKEGQQPLLDDQGNLQYTWIEEQRHFDGTSPNWQDATDVPLEDPRGSIQVADGVYKNLAHNANGELMPPLHVILWAGVQIAEDDWEHVFYDEVNGFAIAQSDWVMGTWRPSGTGTDDYVVVKQCETMDGDVPFGPEFNVYFYQRQGGYDPAIFGPRTVGYPPTPRSADVISFQYDYRLEKFYCTSPDAYDDQLGCVKFFWNCLGAVGSGWWPCDGTTPSGSKIGQLPDTRGYYTRALETQGDTLWEGGGTQAAAGSPSNTSNNPPRANGAGGRVGVNTSRQNAQDSLTMAPITDGGPGPHEWVRNLEDVPSWNGDLADGEPVEPGNTDTYNNQAVVAPPTVILTQIIRCW